ncbi:MAG TPA: alpha/beta hydrolase [Pseudonocardiaceae bacterium]|jgi:acetyl esterase/lipase|nr:alpha/beta hydrolase [Pseudonocardiaceae bacterium]
MTDVIGPPPPFDPELAAAIAIAGEKMPDIGRMLARGGDAVATARALRDEMADFLLDPDADLTRDGAFTVSEREVSGPDGAPDITLLICRPNNAPPPVGVIYFVHGGGMVVGDRFTGLANFLGVAEELGVAVVSVEYRLAPEHPHPAPVDDCYAGLLWTVEHAEELGVDPARVVIAGGSAGGGLTAATALLAKDRGGPALLGQLLLCPMLDDRNDTYSARQMAGVGLWDQTANQFGWSALLGDAQGGDDVSPYAAPARATDLSGLPPAFIDVGSAETFRDEAVEYASRIWRAGGIAELHVWPGGFHGFSGIVPQAAVSQAAGQAPRAWLRRILAD